MKILKLPAFALAAIAFAPLAPAQTSGPPADEIARGKYLATFGGCADCHTAKVMTEHGPAPDASRMLAGHFATTPLPKITPGVVGPSPKQWGAMTNSDLTAWVGPWGVSFAANLTPDKTTGLGNWTPEQFIATMRTGKHLGVGRPLLPPMPFFDVAVLTDSDMKAVFAYLGSLKPIVNQVPAPIPPTSPAAPK
jgi:mono/diheme cytochrome c family protein